MVQISRRSLATSSGARRNFFSPADREIILSSNLAEVTLSNTLDRDRRGFHTPEKNPDCLFSSRLCWRPGPKEFKIARDK